MQLQVLDLVPFVEQSLDRLRPLLKGRPIEILKATAHAAVQADPTRLEQVIGNLVSNAHKYGFPDTPIRVRIEAEDDHVKVAIINEGHGIPANELPSLFNRFTRTQAAHNGTVSGLGLGLYICRGIIENLSGKIWVESKPEEITTFAFKLPIKQPEVQAHRG